MTGSPAPSSIARPALITSLRQLYSTSEPDLAQGQSFELEGTVLCYDQEWNQFFVQNADGLAYFYPQGLQGKYTPGDQVVVRAKTAGIKGIPLTNLTAVVIGHAGVPAARQVQTRELAKALDAWVEFTAEVRLAETSRGRLELTLYDRGNGCQAFVMGEAPAEPLREKYVGSRVRVRGIVTAGKNASHQPEVRLIVPDLKELTIVQEAAFCPRQLPLVSIEALLNRELGPWTNTPVHLNGLVSAAVAGQSLVLKDPTGLMTAHVQQIDSVEPGTRVEVWGYLQDAGGQAVLKDAYFQATLRTAPLEQSRAGSPETNRSKSVAFNIAEMRSFSRPQLQSGVEARLRGTVVYSDPEWRTAFFHDGKLGTYAELSQTDIVAGQVAELRGTARAGNFAPIIQPAHFQVLGVTNLPMPTLVELDDVAGGRFDAQWVGIRATVRRAAVEKGHLYLSMMTPKGKFNVVVPGYKEGTAPANLVDSLVLAQGVCGSELNSRKQVTGITLYMPTLEQLVILQPSGPSDTPTVPIAAVATFESLPVFAICTRQGRV